MRTAKNILRHELIGLECEVVKAGNPQNVGIKGRIVDETLKTLVIKDAGGSRRVAKPKSVFRVVLGAEKADIDGDYIVARPEDRIKKKFKKW
ncbi:MAG: ribonuclease P protein component 1 [Candidatus Aenigmarchaeota archaeon]|nr:ribonuclease P protein component 1 [Candidatus Aenigmarchaeota archaeon]